MDTLARDPEVLKDIGRRFGGRLALDADVARGGTIRIGDDVLIDEQASDRTGSHDGPSAIEILVKSRSIPVGSRDFNRHPRYSRVMGPEMKTLTAPTLVPG